MSDFDESGFERQERHDMEEWARWNEEDVWSTTAAAKKGDVEAQNRLGYYYMEGYGSLEKDLSKAAYWYGKAAESGHAEAKEKFNELIKDKNNWDSEAIMYAQKRKIQVGNGE